MSRDRSSRSRDVVLVATAVPLVLLVLAASLVVGYLAALALCDVFYRWLN